MPHYMFTASLSEKGFKGALEEGAGSRMRVVESLFESLGGSVSTTVLLTAEEVDEARGRTLKYRAPGS